MVIYGNRTKADWKRELRDKFRSSGLKQMTARGYACQLLSFCELVSDVRLPFIVRPDTLLEMELEEIEDLAEEHCRRFDGCRVVDISSRLPLDAPIFRYSKTAYRVPPKRLNIQISALKKWLHINWRNSKARLKNPRLFRQFKFDRTSRLNSGLREERLSIEQVAKIFSMADGADSIVFGFYVLMAFRPSLIPAIKVKHLHPWSYEIKEGVFKWMNIPPLLIVPHQDEMGNHLIGNKASFEYPLFIPTAIARRIEIWINDFYEVVTPESKLNPADNSSDVYYIMKKYFHKIGFNGRPYMARKFASDTILKQLEYGEKGDTLLKETMCGHKKGVQQIYDILSGLNEEKILGWQKHYVRTVDNYVNENIFNINPAKDMKAARILVELAADLGIDVDHIFTRLENGNIDLNTFRGQVAPIIQRGQGNQLEAMIRRIVRQEVNFSG